MRKKRGGINYAPNRPQPARTGKDPGMTAQAARMHQTLSPIDEFPQISLERATGLGGEVCWIKTPSSMRVMTSPKRTSIWTGRQPCTSMALLTSSNKNVCELVLHSTISMSFFLIHHMSENRGPVGRDWSNRQMSLASRSDPAAGGLARPCDALETLSWANKLSRSASD